MAPRLIDGVPPRYPVREELGAEEASRRLKAVIGKFFDRAERIVIAREKFKRRRAGPRLQVRAAAGLGKTAVVIEELAQREFWSGRNVEYYVPTTALAEELATKIRAKGLSARVIKGRSNGAPDNPMCAKFKAAEKAAQLGLNVFGTLCKRRQPGGRELVCPHYDTCPYIAQWQDTEPAIRIFAHNYLGLPRPHPDRRGLPEPDLVIIDESAIQSLIDTCSFGIDRLEAPVRDAVLDQIDKGIDLRQALRDRGITAASARQRANELRERVETDVTPVMPELEARKRLHQGHIRRLLHPDQFHRDSYPGHPESRLRQHLFMQGIRSGYGCGIHQEMV